MHFILQIHYRTRPSNTGIQEKPEQHTKISLPQNRKKVFTKMGKKNSKLKQDTIDRLTTDTYCKYKLSSMVFLIDLIGY